MKTVKFIVPSPFSNDRFCLYDDGTWETMGAVPVDDDLPKTHLTKERRAEIVEEMVGIVKKNNEESKPEECKCVGWGTLGYKENADCPIHNHKSKPKEIEMPSIFIDSLYFSDNKSMFQFKRWMQSITDTTNHLLKESKCDHYKVSDGCGDTCYKCGEHSIR